VKQGQNCRPGYQTLYAPLSGNLQMVGAIVRQDVRLRFFLAALLERQLNAQLQSLLLGHCPELVGCECPRIGDKA
jgi:hypothetical protein